MSFRQRIILLGLVDFFIISIAVFSAYLLRFDFIIKIDYFKYIPYVIFMHTFLILVIFSRLKLYKRVWQYASVGELISIIKGVTLTEVLFFMVHFFILQQRYTEFIVPRSIYLIAWALIILGIGGSRFVWRIYRDSYLKIQPYHKRALIIGAGDAGALIAKELKHSPNTALYPVAFVDDDPAKQSLEVLGLPIVGMREDIPNIVKDYHIDEIIIAMPSAEKSVISEVINLCKTTKANIKILPRVSDIVHGKISLNMIREVNVEDLLGREPVEVDLSGITDYMKNQVVLVTGAGGSIGSELTRQIAPFSPKRILLLGHGENSIYDIELELKNHYPELEIDTLIADVQDRKRLKVLFEECKPNVVFHAAAHKHVPLMERNPMEAVKNNVFGTKNVAECADQHGVSHFVMISTDKAVNPTSVMGTTKRIAEMIVQNISRQSKTKFVAVRFGNVLGSRGSVIPVFKEQIKRGGPVTVTHPDMVRYFMTIPEAVQLVIQAGALAEGGEIFILDMGKPVKIVDLARDLIRLSGFEPEKDIDIVFSGIRPGEKLFEEILTDEEGMKATKHDRIFIGKPIEMSDEEFASLLDQLEQIIYKQDQPPPPEEIKNMLLRIVPSYKYEPNQPQVNGVINGQKKINSSIEHELARQEIKLARIEIASAKER